MDVRSAAPVLRNGSVPKKERQDQTLVFNAERFIWGVGIECSTLPHLNVDQFAWTQHDKQWRDDFKRVVQSGATHLRYAIPWHWIEPTRGQFEWKAADERISEMVDLGIEPILDVMHFGTPLWLKQAVGDVDFPEALEELVVEMVHRYWGLVRNWCPVNEPLVCALFAGDMGFWPPHSRKWRGYMPVLSRISQAVNRAIRAIRSTAPDVTVILCDAAEAYQTLDDRLRDEVTMRNLRRFILMDLITGRVDHRHPLYDWLTGYGFSELDLDWLRSHPETPDVLGLDYYPHGDWQLEWNGGQIRQRRADVPAGLSGIARVYYDRYELPMIVTETSIEGRPINREIWLEQLLDDAAQLRSEGIPLGGIVWWPLIDHLDWDAAMTHRVSKLHEVGLYKLRRLQDGNLKRTETPLLNKFREYAIQGNGRVGDLEEIVKPAGSVDDQLPPLFDARDSRTSRFQGPPTADGLAGTSAEPALMTNTLSDNLPRTINGNSSAPRRGIVVFSHLRWGFVWQRPQQFLSRFATKQPVLFVEEPIFDLPEHEEPKVELHRVMPSVTVSVVHAPPSWSQRKELPATLRSLTERALRQVNTHGAFDAPLLWYYSPMDAIWSLGHFANSGIVYDCMDELSQFTGAPQALTQAEARLMENADIVFCGGYNLGEKKSAQHPNVHTFGCGVEYHHFASAQDDSLPCPADIDFVSRPILGFFGVVDERLDYELLGELARRRPNWSICIVGPVVKVNPSHLPHSPNLFWLGGRDYSVLPDYCRAFNVCLMPFAMNKATEFINPTKGLEYMATGRPIVSTPVRDVVRQWSDIVYIAAGGVDEFILAVEEALRAGHDCPRVKLGLERAAEASWEKTVDRMTHLIADAINHPQRPSARNVQPFCEAELTYHAHTPGS